jgi:hypothetical protein
MPMMIRPYTAKRLAAYALCMAIGVIVSAKTDTARAQSSPPVPLQKYDGAYTGSLAIKTIKQENVTGLAGRLHLAAQSTPCRLLDYSRSLTIKDAQVQFFTPRNVRVTGTVSNDGVIAAFGTTFSGGVRLNGKMQGDIFVGEVDNAYCTFTLLMRKK